MPPKAKGKGEVNEAGQAGASKWGRVKTNLKMGVVGLPNVGKSSLFNLLTEQGAAAENFPFCTIDPNEAQCAVPDQRFKWLCDLYKPPSKVPAKLLVTDIAGLIKGASEGAGLGNACPRRASRGRPQRSWVACICSSASFRCRSDCLRPLVPLRGRRPAVAHGHVLLHQVV